MIHELSLSRLKPGSLNPRQHFDEEALAELTASVVHDGVLENLIVRPEWCVGTVTAADLEKAAGVTPRADKAVEPIFEVVSGERRLRAATAAATGKRVALSAFLVPVRVKPMTDPEALRINLTEQLQRNQLTPLEEADGFAQMLAYKDEKGKPLHTTESLAGEVGMKADYVRRRLKLRSLSGPQQKALLAGKLAPSVADLIARVPDAEDREKFGTLCISGGRDGEPLTYTLAQDLLNEKFMIQLKGAPFDQEDAILVPSADPCSACPDRSGNNPELVKRRARTDMCLNPACFRQKCAAAFGLLTVEARAAGATVLTDDQSAKCFETSRPAEVRIGSDYVELNTRPMEHLLKSEVKNPPMWSDLVAKAKAAGMSPSLVLAKDGDGRGRWLIESAPLMAAAAKLGEPIFRGQKGEDDIPAVAPRAGEDSTDTFNRGKREHGERVRQEQQAAAEEARLRDLVVSAQVRAVHTGLIRSWIKAPIWGEMLRVFTMNGLPLQWVLHRLLATKETDPVKLVKLVGKQPEANRQALVPLLLAAHALHDLAAGNVTHTPALTSFARVAGVDLKTVASAATSAGRKPAAQKPGKKTGKKRGAK